MKIVISEVQLKKIVDSEIDERSRSFAFTRKKRLFPKVAKKYNPNRFKFHDKKRVEINRILDKENEDINYRISFKED